MLEDRERLAREAVRKIKKNLAWMFTREGSRRFWRAKFERENPEVLVQLARGGDKDALEILRKYVRGAARARMGVPTELYEFVWEFFVNGPPKARSGTSLKHTGLRHMNIALLVSRV